MERFLSLIIGLAQGARIGLYGRGKGPQKAREGNTMSNTHNLAITLKKGERFADLKERQRETKRLIGELRKIEKKIEMQIQEIISAREEAKKLDRIIDMQIEDAVYGENRKSEQEDDITLAQAEKLMDAEAQEDFRN